MTSAPTRRLTPDELRDVLHRVPVDRRLAVVLTITRRRQQELAVRAGVSEPRLSRLVAGAVLPTTDERRAIAKALGLKVADLFEAA